MKFRIETKLNGKPLGDKSSLLSLEEAKGKLARTFEFYQSCAEQDKSMSVENELEKGSLWIHKRYNPYYINDRMFVQPSVHRESGCEPRPSVLTFEIVRA